MAVARVETLVCDKCGRRDGEGGVPVNTWHAKAFDSTGKLLRETHGDMCGECMKLVQAVLPTAPGRPRRRRKPVLTDPDTGKPL